LFSKYGTLEKVVIVNDSYTKTSRGFDNFESVEEATTARDGTNVFSQL
jgi:RNA recognition motif-containing protein